MAVIVIVVEMIEMRVGRMRVEVKVQVVESITMVAHDGCSTFVARRMCCLFGWLNFVVRWFLEIVKVLVLKEN